MFSKTSTAGRFVNHVVPAVIKPMRVLWNEIIGFFFFVLAAMAIPSTWRNLQSFLHGEASIFRFLLPAAFASVLIYFAISSFFRARKINKS
jgi:hypothetical protein